MANSHPSGSSPISYNSYQPGRVKVITCFLRGMWSQPTTSFETAAHATLVVLKVWLKCEKIGGPLVPTTVRVSFISMACLYLLYRTDRTLGSGFKDQEGVGKVMALRTQSSRHAALSFSLGVGGKKSQKFIPFIPVCFMHLENQDYTQIGIFNTKIRAWIHLTLKTFKSHHSNHRQCTAPRRTARVTAVLNSLKNFISKIDCWLLLH